MARARWRSDVVLVRIEKEGVNDRSTDSGDASSRVTGVILARESDHAAADVLRETLGSSQDLSGPGERVEMADLEILSPVVNPSKLLGVGFNYADHAEETGDERPKAPLLFLKAPSAIVGPGDPIRFRHSDSVEVDYEAELALVIGRKGRDISRDDALSHVLGYTLCDDVSARDAQFGDGQWMRGKSFDTFAPLGPWIVTVDELGEASDLAISCRVNGTIMQTSRTSRLLFGVRDLVSYASRFMTLEPGDVISTGTPEGVGYTRKPPVYLSDGDLVEVDVDDIGVLSNTVSVWSEK
ncbi:MAG: fumarylacetoacetate hydrolase family protein [Acidimicrobiales bacterium]